MILILGHKGNMGRRYAACLNRCGEPFKGIDIGEDRDMTGINGVIVSTPTESHIETLLSLWMHMELIPKLKD